MGERGLPKMRGLSPSINYVTVLGFFAKETAPF